MVEPKTGNSFDKNLFERVMLYNCLIDRSYLETVIPYTKPSFFDNEKNRSVFSYLLSYFLEYSKVPNITELKIHLPEIEKRQILKDVINTFEKLDKSYDKDVLLKVTEKFLKEKTVLQTVQKTSVEIQSGNVDSSQILKDFEKACNINLIENIGFDYLESIDQHCEDLKKVNKTISTGWKWLDEKLGGGFLQHGKAVYLFFGATNVGKSIFLGNIATNVLAQNKTVLLITLEMSQEIYSKRTSAQLSKIPMNDLVDTIEPLRGSLNTYKTKHSDAKLIIKEFPPKSVTPMQIKGYIQRLVRKDIKPDLIVLDYLSLISPPINGKNSYESQKEIAEQIRALSYEFECSIVTAVQMNREGYKQKEPDLDTTGESMGISHTVDAQISIWVEDEDFDLGVIHYGIVKNRFGPRGCSSILDIDYPTLSLKDPDETSKSFSPPVEKIPGDIENNDSNNLVKSTLDILSGIGED